MSGAKCPGPVLVTGATRRIGLAIAEGFAKPGGRSSCTLRPAPCRRRRGGADAAGPRPAGGDSRGRLSDALEARGLIERAERAFGPFTLLVNNASVFEPDGAEDFSLEVYERQMAVNLRAPLLLAQGFAARLPPGAEGAIVNVIDQRVWRLTPRYFSYTLSKSALVDRDAHDGASLCAEYSRQRGGAGAGVAEREAWRAGVRGGGRRRAAGPSGGARRSRRRRDVFGARAQCDGPDDRGRQRPASCVADADVAPE